MRKSVWILFFTLAGGGCAFSQSQSPDALVNEWLKRLNALADWSSGSPAPAIDRLAELYDPNVLQFTGPNENQIGPVTYSGLEGIRKWADNFAHAYSKSEFRVQVHTEHVKTAGLLLTVAPPWGGLAVAVELTGFYTVRENHKSFMTPAAAFFDFTETGKIKRARIYIGRDETVEITR